MSEHLFNREAKSNRIVAVIKMAVIVNPVGLDVILVKGKGGRDHEQECITL